MRLFLIHLLKANRLNISLLQTALKNIKQEGNDADLKLAGFLWDIRYVTVAAASAHAPITNTTLSTAEPRIVPTPMSPFVTNTPVRKNEDGYFFPSINISIS